MLAEVYCVDISMYLGMVRDGGETGKSFQINVQTENSKEHNMLFRILWTNTERISSKTEIASGERKMEDFYGAMLNCSI